MFKRNIKLLTVLLAIALIVGVSIFYACKKEESIVKNTIIENTEKNYIDHIEELIATTGIDIKELAQLEKIRKIANVPQGFVNAATETSDSKGLFTEEKLTQMQDLLDAIYAASNDNEILTLYESFCAICMTIDGFNMNQYGIPIFTYDPENPFVVFENETINAVALYEEIGNNYLSFSSLPPEIQIEIVAAALYLNLQNSGPKGLSEADCKKAALNDYAISCVTATALLEGALIGCAFSGPAAPGCCAIAGASYGVAMGVAYWQYKRAVRRC